jgi:predicted nucleotidyltransferase
MKERVLSERDRIQREYDVRVLLAVESGSRAWGFASPDSDYDVRFIYVHRPEWYVSVYEQRDVIEEMLPGDLDVSGWELRKTLRLFAKCNLALNEWLGSPMIYSEVIEFKSQLRSLIPSYFNPIAAIHHYRSMAETALNDNFADGHIRIKKLFYVLRPLLACRWIEQTQTQPPTEFERLVDSDWVSREEKEWIAETLKLKAVAAEAERISLDPSWSRSIVAELERFRSAAGLVQPIIKSKASDLDAVLRAWVSHARKIQ